MDTTLTPITPPRRRAKSWTYVGLAAWALLCVICGASLMSEHLLTLPAPVFGDAQLRDAVAASRGAGQRGWLVLHVVSEDCGCSQRVLRHLVTSRRPAGVAERVVLVTDHPAAPGHGDLAGHGLELDAVSPDELIARYRIEAAPLMVVLDPSNTVRYVGGYTPRKQAADIRDVAIVEAVRRGDRVEALPAFGCAVGAALKSEVDPLGLRNRY